MLVAAVTLLVACATWGLARARSRLPSVTRQEVSLETVRRETLVEVVSGPGRLVPVHVRWLTATHRARIELSSGAAGVVNSVAMEPGQWVEAGVLLAKVSLGRKARSLAHDQTKRVVPAAADEMRPSLGCR